MQHTMREGTTVATDQQPVCTAVEALDRLKAGNARFVSGSARFPTVQKEILAELAKGQQPYATILGCSDSRVPPELVFDAGFGELFVIRVAGNVLGPAVLGTLQYAGAHLHTPLFVVLGHEGCGRGECRNRVEVSRHGADEPHRGRAGAHRAGA
jgi:carbonic anhydrase